MSILKVDSDYSRAGRGGGDQVHEKGATTDNVTGGGVLGYVEMKIFRKLVETGGA